LFGAWTRTTSEQHILISFNRLDFSTATWSAVTSNRCVSVFSYCAELHSACLAEELSRNAVASHLASHQKNSKQCPRYWCRLQQRNNYRSTNYLKRWFKNAILDFVLRKQEHIDTWSCHISWCSTKRTARRI